MERKAEQRKEHEEYIKKRDARNEPIPENKEEIPEENANKFIGGPRRRFMNRNANK